MLTTWGAGGTTASALVRGIRGFAIRAAAPEPWSQIVVVTRGCFIRALTGLKVPTERCYGSIRPDREPELLFVPDAGYGRERPLMRLPDPC
jgi:hypothetical protein